MTLERELAGLVGDLPEGISEGVALGTGLADGYDLYESPIGSVVVTFNLNGVSGVGLADEDFEGRFRERTGRALFRAEPPRAWARHVPEALEAGRPGKVPVDLRSVTPFQERVLRVTAGIPRGEVRPYSWLAKEVGKPSAVRAAGSAVARNPVPLMIPCHRVVRADGRIGNYSLGNPENKVVLLSHEGADPSWLERLAGRGVRYRANTQTKIFCHPTCRMIRRSKPENVVDLHGIEETAGYRACEICRPV
ncbi:MAG TPA: methylated-DNA--[protein]-cysteine S-methyltransferase [Acidimicrobiia bacterium]